MLILHIDRPEQEANLKEAICSSNLLTSYAYIWLFGVLQSVPKKNA